MNPSTPFYFGLVIFWTGSMALANNPPTTPGTANLTAESQGLSEHEVEVTRNIRRQILGDPTLSSNAQNVTVVTRGSQVVLRGSVPSLEESKKVEKIARNAAFHQTVVNHLVVTAPSDNK